MFEIKLPTGKRTRINITFKTWRGKMGGGGDAYNGRKNRFNVKLIVRKGSTNVIPVVWQPHSSGKRQKKKTGSKNCMMS